MGYVDIAITRDMIDEAERLQEVVRVHRTKASPIDSLVGLLGEFIFAEWFLGDFRLHDAQSTKGKTDFFESSIEIKTSAFPFRDSLNLLVREDYAAKRKPNFYVQVIIDMPMRSSRSIQEGYIGRISGWASSSEVDNAPLKDFGSKSGGRGGYRCHYIPIKKLQSMSTFPGRKVQ